MVYSFLQEHLVAFFLDFLAGIAGIWFSTAIFPLLSDYLTKNSRNSLEKKIQQITAYLEKYDADLLETNSMVLRVSRRFLYVFLSGIGLVFSSIFVFMSMYIDITCATAVDRCSSLIIAGDFQNQHQAALTIGTRIILCFTCVCAFFFGLTAARCHNDFNPQELRLSLSKRIGRLRTRLDRL